MKIEHIALWAQDIEVLKTFYERYFGAMTTPKYINKQKQFHSYFLTFASGARLELMSRPNLNPLATDFTCGYAHLAIAVGSLEKVDHLTQQLTEDGHSVVSAPRWTGDGYYESVIRDPAGNLVELTI